jgi:hypothetical protein
VTKKVVSVFVCVFIAPASVQQLTIKKRIKLNVSIEVPKAELFIEEELLIRV